MRRQNRFHRLGRRFLAAVALVIAAAALRLWPLQGLGLRIPYVTFYPAVMIAGLYGGLSAGLLAALLSTLTILYWQPAGQPFIKDSADWLGIAVFLVNCTMISIIAEAMLRAQARAKQAQEQAEAANRAKSVFLASMSHELRTPLNAILGFSDLMRSDPAVSLEQRENLAIINRSGEHLLGLINDVLDMAKIEAGHVDLEVKPFDLGALVSNITEMLRVRAVEKGLQLLFEPSLEFPRFVKGDEAKLRQVLINLVSNAIKYTHEGGVILRLGIQPGRETSRLMIEVEDSGIGIAVEDQARIFEPFVQVGQPATQKGSGLGLTITRQYVELMGGKIAVESTAGKGSLFRVELPLQTVEKAEVAYRESEKGQIVGLEPGQPEYRILIVEDQLENQLLLTRLLQKAGFRVEVAMNGAEGVEQFKGFQPHFIWMDRRMPVMDGVEATRRIRALDGGKAVKIAAVTASAFGEQHREMLAAGMDDFVRKPYRPAEIFDCLARQLGVRYVYERATAAEVSSVELPLDALAKLPEAMRQELAQALVLGYIEPIAALIQRIAQQDAALAAILMNLVGSFDYLPILKALEAEGSALEANA